MCIKVVRPSSATAVAPDGTAAPDVPSVLEHAAEQEVSELAPPPPPPSLLSGLGGLLPSSGQQPKSLTGEKAHEFYRECMAREGGFLCSR